MYEIGDVVIDRGFNKNGVLAIVVGTGITQPILLYHNRGIFCDELGDGFSTWNGLEMVGHIDFEKIWAEAVSIADRKTEPTISKMEQVATDTNVGHKDEPKTQMKTQNSNLTFEKRTMRDCYNCKRYETEGECIECHYEPKDEPQTENPCDGCVCDDEKHLMYCMNCKGIAWKTEPPKIEDEPHIVGKHADVTIIDEPQTDTEIAKAIVHKMIDDAVIAEDAYPDLRQRMHDAVDNYEPQTERSE